MRNPAAVALVVLVLACATPRLPDEPADWTAVDEHWSVHLVTRDPDGDERVTRIWIATLDGTGVIRSGESRWQRNLTVDPECRLRVSGVDYPVRVEFVTGAEEIERIDAAFLEKYGWQARMVRGTQSGDGHDHTMRLVPR